MSHDLSKLTEALLAQARKAGAEAADALAVAGNSQSIDIRLGKLEQAERSEGVEIGLRVMLGGRQACVSASDISAATMARLAERAVAMAREAPEDPTVGLATRDQIAGSWDLSRYDLADPGDEPSPQDLEADARAVEAAALDHAGITQVEASAAWSGRAMHLATSNGFSGGYTRTSRSLSAVAFTGSGTNMERDWAGEGRIYAADMPQASEIGALAAQRTLQRAGSVKPPTGAFPVLYDERIASSLIGHLLSAINGASIARGASWLLDALGKQILPAGLSVIEDPHRPRISGSRPFDGEGLPTARRMIVQDGILMGWTLDLGTARKLGMTSTANASRGTSSPPSPSTSNIDLTQGSVSRDDLLRDMGTGLLVTSMIGSTINPTTGDYSRGASGFWVENGVIAFPVEEITIAGNLKTMLLGIDAIGADAYNYGAKTVGSILVNRMKVAGT